MSETLGLKNINLLTKEQYNGIEGVAADELYAISGSGFGFPSDRYDDLTLGASDTTYTAPATGWFSLAKKASSTGQYLTMRNIASGVNMNVFNNGADNTLRVNIPCRKNDKIFIGYAAGGAVEFFRFIYAEGE